MSDHDGVIEDVVGTLSNFHHQPSLSLFKAQLEEKRPAIRFIVWMISVLRRYPIGLRLLVVCAIMFYPRRWFSASNATVYVVSLTRNNAHVLQRLNAMLETACGGFAVNSKRLPLSQRWRACMRIADAVQVLECAGDKADFVFLHQVLGAAAALCFDTNLAQIHTQVVLAANDHSPATVALFAVARARGLRSCYIQHGSVTDSFPPLRYNLSILQSQQAYEAYQAASVASGVPQVGDICFLPALSDPAIPLRAMVAPYDICIALSFFPDLDQIGRLVGVLQAREDVRSIKISQHPRCQQDLSLLVKGSIAECLNRGTTAKDIAPDVDLCLVENSGVALEFLHFGCPTFYLTQSDPTLDDYYGFVAGGVLMRFSDSILDEPSKLAVAFGADWRNRLAHFDPLIDNNIEELNGMTISHFQNLLTVKSPL